jgi:phosphomannomutase / phosphoglucomutase
MAYFAQLHLDAPAVAMVTASHNPNGWTGVKMGFEPPLTHGPDEMAELRDIVLAAAGRPRPGRRATSAWRACARPISTISSGDFRLTRPLRVVCATGNGTAGRLRARDPRAHRRRGGPVAHRLDYTFPHYNPNPEALEMLEDMAGQVRATGADLALGFDGDGDRCGVVDDEGHEIFADKVGVILARDLAGALPGATSWPT